MTKEEAQENNSELEELKKKCEEYLNGWKRERADFLNYKKEEMERIGQLVKYASTEVILSILPIFDNLYLFEKHSNILQNTGMSEWREGFNQIKKQIEEFLKQGGIEEIEVVGKKFDPETMEAVEEVEANAASDEASASQAGMVIEELQKGYMMQGKVLRPAKVKVVK